MASSPSGRMTSLSGDDSSLPLIHDPEAAAGSSYPGLDEAPTQVKPHSALLAAGALPEAGNVSPHVLGARLDHFELLDSIGVGGMGRVFRSRDTRLDRLVALKVLSPELSNDPEICRRFEQEAKAAARLDDRHFARVYFFGFDKGLRYIAMEYVEGENIRQKIQKSGRLSVALVVNIGIQIARGLSHAASCGVVHRDIKPSNIILTPDGTAKLVDMGLARNFFQQSSPASELTQAGVTLGTFDYISPEQALDPRDADVRSDIYSLGCTLYHALTGRPPFNKGSALQKILQHQNDAVPDPRRFAPDLPEPVVAILLKMLAKEPKDRYQHPAELIDDLRAVAGLLDVPLPDEQGYSAVYRPQTHFWENQVSWLAPLVVLFAAIGIYAWIDKPSQPMLPLTPAIKPTVEDTAVPSNAPASAPRPAPELLKPKESASSKPVVEDTLRPLKSILVAADQDLFSAIKQAEPGTALRLTGTKYVISATSTKDSTGTSQLIIDKRLRIEPAFENGLVEIVLQSNSWPTPQETSLVGSSLIRVRKERVEFHRIAWIVESPVESSVPRSIFSIMGGGLHMNDCFLRVGNIAREQPIAAIQIESSESRQEASFEARQSFFLGADEVIRVLSNAGVRIELIECGMDQLSRLPFRLEGLGDVAFAIEHSTVRTTASTMFRIQRFGGVRLQVHDSVFSTSSRLTNRPAVFAEFTTDGSWPNADDHWWSGRENLLQGFNPLTILRGGSPIATSLGQARQLGFEETSLTAVESQQMIWMSDTDKPLPLSAETGLEAVSRLRLKSEFQGRGSEPIGFRISPWGDIYATAPEVVETPSASNSTPESVSPVPLPTPAKPSVVIVDPSAKASIDAGIFNKLMQACDSVTSEATIEIRANGAVSATDVVISAPRVTIRAAAGYSPILVLDGTKAGSEPSASMIRVSSQSKLEVHGLPMVARTDGEKDVAVFDIEAGGEVAIDDSPIHIDIEQMRSRATLAQWRPGSSNTSAPAKIRLSRSSVRTSGNIVRLMGSGGFETELTDSFLLSARPFLTMSSNAASPAGSFAALSLNRCTLLLGESLVSMSADRAGAELPKLERLDVNESLILGYGSSPLFSIATNSGSKIPLPKWTGKDAFITGFAIVWGEVALDMTAAASGARRQLGPEDWRKELNLNDVVSRFGLSEPFSLSGGNIANQQPPTLLMLRRAGYPVDAPRPMGVSAQFLPIEPAPGAVR
ncbi:serine/threonine protein kinase [bacterium]|nr:serine/threonine protein kinase [bacterium]